jgi:aryl-alcohol dehydrogenase-like predicted oxidoreductase
MERAMALAPITSNQHQYNLLNREIEHDVLQFSQQHNIGILCWSPLASGFLADNFDVERLDPNDFRRERPYAQEPAFSKLKKLRGVLLTIARAHHKTMAELALAWVLRQPAVSGAINGIRSPQEALAMPGCLNWKLTDHELQTIEESLTFWNQP